MRTIGIDDAVTELVDAVRDLDDADDIASAYRAIKGAVVTVRLSDEDGKHNGSFILEVSDSVDHGISQNVALRIVRDLAYNNILDERECQGDDALMESRNKQLRAINLLDDMIG